MTTPALRRLAADLQAAEVALRNLRDAAQVAEVATPERAAFLAHVGETATIMLDHLKDIRAILERQ